VEGTFHKETNKTLRNGKVIRWILKDKNGKSIGRVAAFINEKTASKDNDQPTGGMGFFECINDKEAAFMLFDACKNWLAEQGMEAMDGPINFGERDKWWGLLVDGFDKEPNYCCNYNFSYYKELFEAYGFKLYFNQYTYYRKTMDPLPVSVQEKAERIARDPNYKFVYLKKNELEKFAEDFRTIYNKAWVRHKGVAQMSSLQAKAIFKKMKPLIDERIIWYGYYGEDPISFFIMLPEFNQIVKHVNGKLNWLGKLKFVYHKYRKTCRKMFGVVFGVVPEHQGKGVEGAMVMATRKMVQDEYQRYDELEMNWIGDFNPKMMRVAEHVGGTISKTHVTYRKLFDETKEFKRADMKG
ncbi:MAG: hypothetical protein OEY34_04115, partial [Cyclobacteriaceae bacterium]|nr:hypothetical protein [Cyclobacteriaceae bacterium]